MDFKSLLNDRQYEAVSSTSQHLRIIAGAGSGKTRVLTFRIAYLISEMGVSPDEILAITFTNKVANEMKNRALALINSSDRGYRHLNISTFHSFCAKFLRYECRAMEYPPSFSIFDEDDQARQVRAIGEAKGYRKGDIIIKDALSYIRRQKGRGLYPQDIDSKNLYGREKSAFEFYEEYERRKTSCYALDFDDLLLMTIKILKLNPGIRDYWSHRFKHILIDEFQDTNDVQMELVYLLSNPSTSVYVVGDPDQTIYTWRGANQGIILNFEKKFPGATTIILDRNYRSTKNILDAANKLIAYNKQRVPKALYTLEEGGAPVEVKSVFTTEKEADWVATKVLEIASKQKLDNGDYDYSNIALLYRSNYMSRPFELAFGHKGIPYKVYGGHRFYDRLEVKDILAYCTLMVNKRDDISFERIVNVPRRGFGDNSQIILRNEAHALKMSEFEYIEHLKESSEGSELLTKHIRTLINLVDLINETRARLEAKDELGSSIIQDFITKIGYLEYIADKSEEDEDRVGNCKALFDDIMAYEKNNPEASFAEYLQNVTLLTSQDEIEDSNHVVFMTVHTAKGLEFDYVFVVNMNDNAFPSKRAIEENPNALEEERRLAYVAYTRAKKKLFLTGNLAYSYATDSTGSPSRFIKEAGLKVQNEYSFKRQSFAKNFISQNSLFDDGNHYDPFLDEKPAPKKVEEHAPNDIVWRVGDKLEHDTFGKGEVIEVNNDTIIVNFDNFGKKILLGNHFKLHKIHSKGGLA